LGVALLSREALHLISGPEYWRAYSAVPVIAAAYLIWSTRSVIEVGIVLERKTVVVTICFVMGAVISVAANVLLIPRLGMLGAAYATLVSFSAMVALDYSWSRRLFLVRYEWGRLVRIVLATGLVFCLGAFWEIDRAYVAIPLKLSLVAIFPLVLWLTGFYTLGEIKGIRRLVRSVPRVWRKLVRMGSH
jgi:O-antigen/teichoic acid export membrane protein